MVRPWIGACLVCRRLVGSCALRFIRGWYLRRFNSRSCKPDLASARTVDTYRWYTQSASNPVFSCVAFGPLGTVSFNSGALNRGADSASFNLFVGIEGCVIAAPVNSGLRAY